MKTVQHIHAVILAGGEGVRFAPLSTPERPKQFLSLFDDRTMIQQTVDRLHGWIPPERLVVATNARYQTVLGEQLPQVPADNVILETAKRNTAPAIARAARVLFGRDPEAVMVVLPADHVILDRAAFLADLSLATEIAVQHHALVTLGVQPSYASTEYGYIQHGALLPGTSRPAYRVQRFVEKPNLTTAERYLADGGYYWNSGMFIWEVRTILEEVRQHLPTLAKVLDAPDFFERVEAVSIDYGVMERSQRAVTIPCRFGWSDIGSWDSLRILVDQEGLNVRPDVRRYLDTRP